MTHSTPRPTDLPLHHRQEKAIDRLLDLLRAEDDPEQVQSIVSIIAEGSGVPLMALPDDPFEKADQLGGAWLTALWQAGEDNGTRSRAARMAVRHIRELLAVVDEWDEQEGTSVIRQWSGGAIRG